MMTTISFLPKRTSAKTPKDKGILAFLLMSQAYLIHSSSIEARAAVASKHPFTSLKSSDEKLTILVPRALEICPKCGFAGILPAGDRRCRNCGAAATPSPWAVDNTGLHVYAPPPFWSPADGPTPQNQIKGAQMPTQQPLARLWPSLPHLLNPPLPPPNAFNIHEQPFPPPRGTHTIPRLPLDLLDYKGGREQSNRGARRWPNRRGGPSRGSREEQRRGGSNNARGGGVIIQADNRQIIGTLHGSPLTTPRARAQGRPGVRGRIDNRRGQPIIIDNRQIINILPESLTSTPDRSQGRVMRGLGRGSGGTSNSRGSSQRNSRGSFGGGMGSSRGSDNVGESRRVSTESLRGSGRGDNRSGRGRGLPRGRRGIRISQVAPGKWVTSNFDG